MDVMCLGIVTCDILVRGADNSVFDRDSTTVREISMAPGGDALNVAVNLSKMGFSSGICGKLGKDSYGDYVVGQLKATKVNTDCLIRDEQEKTAVSVALISEEGKRNFLFCPGATEKLTVEDAEKALPEDFKFLDVGSYFALPGMVPEKLKRLLQKVRQKGVYVVLDVTGSPTRRNLSELEIILPYIDYFIPSFEEAAALTGKENPKEIAEEFRKRGAGTVIIKLGDKGSAGLDTEGFWQVSATQEESIDTTGAGDCFVAGVIAGLLKGSTIREATQFASKAAGLSVTKIGATTATVPYEEIAARHVIWKGDVKQVEGHYDNL